jgi:phospholipase A1/A2
MNILNAKSACKLTVACVFFLLIAALPGGAAEIDDGLAKCAKIENDNAKRLQCFDELAKKQIPIKETVTAGSAEKTAAKEPAAEKKVISVMEKYWDMSLDPNKERNIFVLWPYRPNYFLPVTYNSSPNEDAQLDIDPQAKTQYTEAKFQISFKMKVWEDLVRGSLKNIIENNTGIKGIDVWIAYTQQSFWQLYNSAFSSPFRDTNYEPELLFNIRTQYEIPGLMGTKLQFINVGFNHQSNGRSVPLSRSWNRIVANFGVEKDNFGLLFKTWYRIPEDETSDDNPDISRYMGYGELWGTLYWKKQRFAVMLRNNLRSENFGAVQLDWSIPLSVINKELGDKFSFYIQYFNGYGESLLDYNKSINRIGVGFMLADWN